jgi:hypothetical protein
MSNEGILFVLKVIKRPSVVASIISHYSIFNRHLFRVAGCTAKRALRFRSVPSELEGFYFNRSALQVKRSSSAALLFIF